jgi:DNA adenine methylase
VLLSGYAPTRPFLKWAGGKRQLLPALRRYYPRDFGTYFEPFLGSGAVFFDLHAAGLLDGRPARLTDTNRDVIGCYLAVRDRLDRVIGHLQKLAAGHAAGGADHYYDVRDQRFNPSRQRLFKNDERPPAGAARSRAGAPVMPVMPERYPAELAAMFIYLNRTGYNGLFRLNRRGGFNVPAGRYANPKICDVDTLRAVHAALTRPGVAIEHASFEHVAGLARAGDFLYFDPPYAPLSPTARFTAYTADGFDTAAQERLQRLMVTLARRRCHLLLSNSNAPEIRALYRDHPDVAAAGLRVAQVPARRAINSHAGRRGPIAESLIMNLPAARPSRKRQLGVDSTIANGGRLRKHAGGHR